MFIETVVRNRNPNQRLQRHLETHAAFDGRGHGGAGIGHVVAPAHRPLALDEAIHRTGRDYSFIVFASDVDQRALKVARAGFYPESIAADVSPSRLRAYFDKPDDHYRVKRSLRERVVFAAQNVIEDPPYSRLDLISCRNLLMYFKPETQKQEADHRDISFCA